MSSEPGLPRLEDLDFGAMYRRHMREHQLVPKPPSAWDSRAASFGSGSVGSVGQGGAAEAGSYVQRFLATMDLDGVRSVLDVGSGPGTLALPLAARGHEVVALDNSPRMLEELQRRAAAQGVGNVRTLLRAWEDDWADVPVCDIAIASRSTLVDDLEAALRKLAAHARRQVCLSYPIDGFVDPQLLEVTGATLPRAPAHLLLLGMLHRMGVAPRVEVVQTASRLAGCADFESFADRLAWSTGPLNEAALLRLRAWWQADPGRAARGGRGMRWAVVAWDADGADTPAA